MYYVCNICEPKQFRTLMYLRSPKIVRCAGDPV